MSSDTERPRRPTSVPRAANDEGRPEGALPPFTDPAFSPVPARPPVDCVPRDFTPPPKDTEFAGHPEFSEEAAGNKPPKGMGLGEPVDEVDGKTAKSEGVDGPIPDRDERE